MLVPLGGGRAVRFLSRATWSRVHTTPEKQKASASQTDGVAGTLQKPKLGGKRNRTGCRTSLICADRLQGPSAALQGKARRSASATPASLSLFLPVPSGCAGSCLFLWDDPGLLQSTCRDAVRSGWFGFPLLALPVHACSLYSCSGKEARNPLEAPKLRPLLRQNANSTRGDWFFSADGFRRVR